VKRATSADLEIYGPPGIYNYIVTNMTHTLSHISLIRIIVYELVDGVEDKAEQLALRRSNSNHSTDRKDPFRSQYHEMEFRTKRNIVRRVIYRNNDHFWNLFEPSPKEVHPGNEKHHSKAGNKNNNNHDNNLLWIQAGEVGHVHGIQSFGYIITELDPPLNIDKDKAIALGVNPGKKYRLLKEGISVEVDDEHTTENGKEKATAAYPDIDIIHEKRNDNDLETDENKERRLVHPHQVLIQEYKRGRKFAYIGDNYKLSPAFCRLAMDCDILVNEATLSTQTSPTTSPSLPLIPKEAILRGHSTAAMSAQVGRDLNAQVLILNHFSASNCTKESMEQMLEEANKVKNNERKDVDTTADGNDVVFPMVIIPSFDLMEVMVPKGGFLFHGTQEENKIDKNQRG